MLFLTRHAATYGMIHILVLPIEDVHCMHNVQFAQAQAACEAATSDCLSLLTLSDVKVCRRKTRLVRN